MHARAPDRWGVDGCWVDAAGAERRVPDGTVARLREAIGEPPPAGPPLVVVTRPGERVALGPGDLELEGGGSIPVDGALPAALPLGYHRFAARDGAPRLVIAAPARCVLPTARVWGWAVQLYAARSARSWGIGDLGDLARLARWSRRLGARFLLVNPLGAAAPAGAQPASPYSPASRRFRNPIYLRVQDVPGAAHARDAVARAARAGHALGTRRRIDRDAVWAVKREALEAIWDAGPPLDEFERWRAGQPTALRQFATWCVLTELHGPRWRDWPAACRSPHGDGVRAVAARHRGRVRFHAWLQWLLERQLAAAAAPVALVHDLPVGVDPDGFDAWAWQEFLAPGVSVGAPADAFAPDGQDWGLPPFTPWRLAAAGYAPFVETVRAALAHGGGLRIDHVMGLFRQWWIPEGGSPADGAYVRYPAGDLLAVVALESHRAGAFVVGEDLGTVEESALAALAAHGVLSYRLLWFERGDPAGWPERSMAAVTTHDLPTVAGLWDGSDPAEQHARPGARDGGWAALRPPLERAARAAGLDDSAPAEAAVLAAYREMARAPSLLRAATLEDAVAAREPPNVPGAARPANWSLALPVRLEDLEAHPLATRLATLLQRGFGVDSPE